MTFREAVAAEFDSACEECGIKAQWEDAPSVPPRSEFRITYLDKYVIIAFDEVEREYAKTDPELKNLAHSRIKAAIYGYLHKPGDPV